MATVEVQNRIKAATEGFGTLEYDFGLAKPTDKVEFKFDYNGEIPLQGTQAQCGCTNVKTTPDGITGVLSLATAENYRAHTHIVDENDMVWKLQGKFAIPADPRLKPVPAKEVNGKPLPSESKTITVYLDDGEDFKTIDENGVIRDNPNKTKLMLTIKGFISV